MHLTSIISKLILILLITELRLYQCQKVETDLGWVLGSEELSEDGRHFYSFRGIPFAQPPVKDLRFEPPRPLSSWEGELDATSHVPLCAQAALGYNEGEEDCLYLSVYTPKLKVNGNLPVLVWIPGGVFVTGGASEYSPHLMMDKDIVLVVPQYRLGMLGFFTLHSKISPGNFGMLDQLEALRWVNRNIQKFGGDPNRVTLGGDCAGGISSILHMMSPLSEGLFQRVISFTGSPLSYWAQSARHNRLGLLVSKLVLCPAFDHEVLVQCFKEKTAEELLVAQRNVLEARDLLIGNHKLAPSDQLPANSHESTLFLDDYPLKKLLRDEYTKLPVLMSVTRDVGSYLVDMGLYDFILLMLEDRPEFLKSILPVLLKEIDIPYFETETEKFRKFYLPDWNYENLDDAIPGLIDLLGDAAFNAPIITLAKMLSEKTETRLLRFDYENGPKFYDERHSGNSTKPPVGLTRISHGDELYFFLPNQRYEMTSEHKNIATKMLNIIEDFVYGRDSLRSWPEFTTSGLETRILSATGEIQDGVRFASEEREQFLQYIFQNQHKNMLELMKKEAEVETQKWIHEEL